MEPALVTALKGAVREIGRKVELERNDFLLQAGEIERSIYFVETGLIRLFLLTEHEEHTIRFGYRGSMVNSIASFLRGHPSEFYVQAIRKSVVWVVSKAEWEVFFEGEFAMGGVVQRLVGGRGLSTSRAGDRFANPFPC